jgi:ABC-type lipoprotein export system ATPase subunit
MTASTETVLEIDRVVKGYQALRPLRLQSLRLAAGERVAIQGIDAGGAEVLINLVTGAGLPDQGEVRICGRATSEITGGDEWLASLDRFGIVSERSVLLEGATVEQNLAMPFTLEIDPVSPATAARVAALAAECGIAAIAGVGPSGPEGPDVLKLVTGEAPPEIRARVHLARAVALDPVLLVLEHPTAAVPEGSRAGYADDIVRLADRRKLSALVITQDEAFASRVAHRVLTLQPATGGLKPARRGWFR